jgi:glycosyltransferase involved in cell wall biosynthesis
MKILHVISSSGMYGAESVIVDLCKWFNRELHQSSVAAFHNIPKSSLELYHHCRAQNIESDLIPARGKLDRDAIKRIRDIVLSRRPDVVHAHGYKADVFVHLALRQMKVPYVATCHNWTDNDSKSRMYGWFDRRILSRFSRIAAVSEAIEKRLLRAGVDANRIEIVRNGIDVQALQIEEPQNQNKAQDHANVVVGFVGRLSPEKGPDLFLRAAKNVLQDRVGVEFLLAGDGPEISTLRQLSDELRISKKVRLLGYVTDMKLFYRDLDVLVASSRREGLPIAILEGMACGLPVVATAVGDIPKIIDHGCTGLLVPPENVPLLAQAILSLIEDPSKRTELGAAARRFITEAFSNDRMGREYLRFYEKALLDPDPLSSG